MECITTL
ncbi:hypothetical protein CRUP_026531 [Coryphaenoides rupestris]|nr:hypothetical protein CRUP_026531 [Coryphaenoides rupestris]